MFERDLARGTEELVEQTVGRWLPGDEERSVRARELARGMTRGCGLEGYKACVGGIRAYDYTEELGRVRARTLVVVGSRDGAVGERGVNEDVARRTGGRFVWLEGAGHLPPIHMPEEFGRLVVEFLEEEG
ncbi:Alpha/Beta hydrolase protein [Elsinoe ampelina]|uniref:Alpha/Beta hydrolase protein n=1 Tax=Elsinoe ampelina TaxID=302913 RepID=A0A6A6GNR3_9PEZI|nr:Alpha/Beta hydrolase protein [Elsinoe ampelina]